MREPVRVDVVLPQWAAHPGTRALPDGTWGPRGSWRWARSSARGPPEDRRWSPTPGYKCLRLHGVPWNVTALHMRRHFIYFFYLGTTWRKQTDSPMISARGWDKKYKRSLLKKISKFYENGTFLVGDDCNYTSVPISLSRLVWNPPAVWLTLNIS